MATLRSLVYRPKPIPMAEPPIHSITWDQVRLPKQYRSQAIVISLPGFQSDAPGLVGTGGMSGSFQPDPVLDNGIIEYRGPDPYVDYDRRFTPEDGIAITYKTIDESGWRTALRILMLLAVTVFAIVYLAKGSPYPMLPRGCPVFGGCPIPMRWDRYIVDAVLLVAFSGLAAWILFAEVQVYREIEIRADCMILDGDGIFWAEKFELGWPQFVSGKDGMQVLTGVYGTRHTEFLKVKAFDALDRGPAVFAAHLMAAMQQQWSPGA